MDAFTPRREDRFTFGLWTVGNPGRDPFGEPVRSVQKPTRIVEKLAECGAHGVNLHDDDLVPFGSSAAERDGIVRDFKAALEANGLVVPMATTNLFSQPVFKDGAFTSNDPAVRAFALQKTMKAIDLGVELGARTYVFWGGREGTEADACRDIGDSVITETAGIGGFAMATAPALVAFIGGKPQDAINTTLDMYEITHTEHKYFTIPFLDFRGTPTGIDIRKVIEKQIAPRANTGVAHKDPGVGQVGAGVVTLPMSPFEDALVAYADKYGF